MSIKERESEGENCSGYRNREIEIDPGKVEREG